MQAIGIHGAFASAAKIASRCRLEDAGDPVVADRRDKPDRWHAARRNGLSAEDATQFTADQIFAGPRRKFAHCFRNARGFQIGRKIDHVALPIPCHASAEDAGRALSPDGLEPRQGVELRTVAQYLPRHHRAALVCARHAQTGIAMRE